MCVCVCVCACVRACVHHTHMSRDMSILCTCCPLQGSIFCLHCCTECYCGKETSLSDLWFHPQETPLPATMFPTWPAKSERPRQAKRERSPSAPKGGAEYNKLAVSGQGLERVDSERSLLLFVPHPPNFPIVVCAIDTALNTRDCRTVALFSPPPPPHTHTP